MSSVTQCIHRKFLDSFFRPTCTVTLAVVFLGAFLQAPAQAKKLKIMSYKGTKILLKDGAKFSRKRDEFYCAERDDPFMVRNFADYSSGYHPLEYRFVVGCRGERFLEPQDHADGVSSNSPGTSPPGPPGPPDGGDNEGEPQ